jgi:RNA polymerase sigma-70 factor, ECF subfamily
VHSAGLTAPALERAYREEWTAVVATLARRLGDLQAAEDATAEAFASAAEHWPRDGVPPKPGAWLTLTAWRKAIDQLRKDRSVLTRHSADPPGRSPRPRCRGSRGRMGGPGDGR